MSAFGDWASGKRWRVLPSSISLIVNVAFLVAWNVVMFVVIVVPAMLLAAVVAGAIWWLETRKVDRQRGSPVIEGEFKVLNPEG